VLRQFNKLSLALRSSFIAAALGLAGSRRPRRLSGRARASRGDGGAGGARAALPLAGAHAPHPSAVMEVTAEEYDALVARLDDTPAPSDRLTGGSPRTATPSAGSGDSWRHSRGQRRSSAASRRARLARKRALRVTRAGSARVYLAHAGRAPAGYLAHAGRALASYFAL
jgi:hypothetical protein